MPLLSPPPCPEAAASLGVAELLSCCQVLLVPEREVRTPQSSPSCHLKSLRSADRDSLKGGHSPATHSAGGFGQTGLLSADHTPGWARLWGWQGHPKGDSGSQPQPDPRLSTQGPAQAPLARTACDAHQESGKHPAACARGFVDRQELKCWIIFVISYQINYPYSIIAKLLSRGGRDTGLISNSQQLHIFC